MRGFVKTHRGEVNNRRWLGLRFSYRRLLLRRKTRWISYEEEEQDQSAKGLAAAYGYTSHVGTPQGFSGVERDLLHETKAHWMQAGRL
jgi:hypothetical protein